MKKRLGIGLFALLLVTTHVFANKDGPKCNPEGAQVEMNVCVAEDYAVADKKLNDTWKVLMKQEKGNKAFIKKIRASQKLWIKFRDAEVAAMFACEEGDMRVCWGTMYPMLYHGALLDITKARTKRLQQYIDNGQTLSGN